MTNILVLIAGTNEPSNTAFLADTFTEGMHATSACNVERIRLKDSALPHFRAECYEESCDLPPEYQTLQREIRGADGVLIATPIWNFGVPAHLKNAVDWMGRFALDTQKRSEGLLGGKPFFFLFTGGAPVAAWKGLMRFTTMFLPESIRYFGGSIVGYHFEGRCMPGPGKFGLVVDRRPESLERVRRKGEDFARFVARFKETGTLPLRYRITEKVYRFGQRIIAKL